MLVKKPKTNRYLGKLTHCEPETQFYNLDHNILRLFGIWPNFPFTKSQIRVYKSYIRVI